MPSFRRVHALILHRTSIREKDRMLDIFTQEEGRLHVFAPGIRHGSSRRAGHVEPLMETTLTLSATSKGDSLREARVHESFPFLREHLPRLAHAYTLLDHIREHYGERIPDPHMYDILLGALRVLNVDRPLPSLLMETFAVHLLSSMGRLPDLYRCSQCRKKLEPDAFAFHGTSQGFLCASCGDVSDVTWTTPLKVLRVLLLYPFRRVQENVENERQTKETLEHFLRLDTGAITQTLRPLSLHSVRSPEET